MSRVYNVIQGSHEWHALRAKYGNRGASNAPVMMGASKKCTRTDLVRMTATGDEREFSEWVRENLLRPGHEVEVFARGVIEEELGEDLFPATIGTDDEYLLASFDGITIDSKTAIEVKLWNEELAAAVRAGAKELPGGHHWQVQQQLMAETDLERVIFVVTDGTREKFLKMEFTRNNWQGSALLAGWKQFDEDVANYQHVEVIPKAVAEPQASLPMLAIDVKGEIELVSNLPRFGEMLKAYVASIPKEPATDQDFANCEAAVKVLKEAEERLALAAANALARFETIDDMRRTVASFAEIARETRLATSKLVESKKAEIRFKIMTEGASAFGAHLVKLNERLGGSFMPTMKGDFAEVMKGKKTVASLRDAVATELARVKIDANAIADRIQVNLNTLRSPEVFAYNFLFADVATIVQKANDDFALLARSRIGEHKAKEEQKLAAERERIRQEEEARARTTVAAAGAKPLTIVANDPQAVTTLHPPGSYDLRVGAGRPLRAPPTTGRPSDDDIIGALADHFHVHESEVITWLLEIDLDAASRRMVATEFPAA